MTRMTRAMRCFTLRHDVSDLWDWGCFGARIWPKFGNRQTDLWKTANISRGVGLAFGAGGNEFGRGKEKPESASARFFRRCDKGPEPLRQSGLGHYP